jgi:hypothetical protein
MKNGENSIMKLLIVVAQIIALLSQNKMLKSRPTVQRISRQKGIPFEDLWEKLPGRYK